MVTPSRALRLVRMPGEFGPILRCSGELSAATVEALRRELAFLGPLCRPVLTLNLSDCGCLDLEGVLAVLQTFKALREKGRHLVVVAEAGPSARLLRVVGINGVLPVFPTAKGASLAMQGERVCWSAPPTRALGGAEAVARWQAVQEALDQAPLEEVLRLLTVMSELCEQPEEIFHGCLALGAARCSFCSLFHELGGRPVDAGYSSLLGPIIDAVRAGDQSSARAQVAAAIDAVAKMRRPEEDRPPGPGPLPCDAGDHRPRRPGARASAGRAKPGNVSVPGSTTMHPASETCHAARALSDGAGKLVTS